MPSKDSTARKTLKTPDAQENRYALQCTGGFEKWKINWLDYFILIKTSDAQDGDFAHVQTPDGQFLGKLIIESPTHTRISWPDSTLDRIWPNNLIRIIGRAVYIKRHNSGRCERLNFRPIDEPSPTHKVITTPAKVLSFSRKHHTH